MYQHTNCEINTAKCLFEREVVKYSSAKFFPLYSILVLRNVVDIKVKDIKVFQSIH